MRINKMVPLSDFPDSVRDFSPRYKNFKYFSEL
jgi:hypothetical protein